MQFLLPFFAQIVPLSLSHPEHHLISSGFVKAGETVGIRVSSLIAWFHGGLSDTISVYSVRPRTWTFLELLPLEVLHTPQPCTATGTARSRAQLMLHCFSLTFATLQKEQFYCSWYPPSSDTFKQLYSFVLPLLFVCCFADGFFSSTVSFYISSAKILKSEHAS